MRSLTTRSFLNTASCILLIMVVFGTAAINPAKAQQKKAADTVSTSDVQFTAIPTAADSIAARKKELAKLAKAKAAHKTAKLPKEKEKTLWQIFIAGLIGGFTAVVLPCIYPLLPLTVSFFTKKGGTRGKAVLQSVIYGLSIILIYVGLGMLISIIFGSDALNELASNGVFN